MKITKKEIKDATISMKINNKKRDKLKTLAKQKDVSFSDLCYQMFEMSYKEITKKDL
jgi:hypothetical protein